MTALYISLKSLGLRPMTTVLNMILVAFGTGMLTVLLLASAQISDKLQNNSKEIDLVVGAKGSPLQLVLSSVFHIDFPTGNIPLKDAKELMANPDIKRAVPLALGDNFNGIRIVGTDHGFIDLYKLRIQNGRFWQQDFETTVGAAVAQQQGLKVGDTFFGAHGLTGNSDVHKVHRYRVLGILRPQGNVTDNLILTSIQSIWKMHGSAENKAHHDNEHNHHQDDTGSRELTSLLIQYRSPMSVATFPGLVNETTNMQAASPAQESTRLFSLIGVGVESLQWLAALIMLLAGISIFISLYSSLAVRAYDLAIMRTLGASKLKIFNVVITEGILVTVSGAVVGIVLGHFCLYVIGNYQQDDQVRLSGTTFLSSELFVFFAALLIGFLSASVPSVQAYRTDISKVLSRG
jgi:putative ABC transport system permease protein